MEKEELKRAVKRAHLAAYRREVESEARSLWLSIYTTAYEGGTSIHDATTDALLAVRDYEDFLRRYEGRADDDAVALDVDSMLRAMKEED